MSALKSWQQNENIVVGPAGVCFSALVAQNHLPLRLEFYRAFEYFELLLKVKVPNLPLFHQFQTESLFFGQGRNVSSKTSNNRKKGDVCAIAPYVYKHAINYFNIEEEEAGPNYWSLGAQYYMHPTGNLNLPFFLLFLEFSGRTKMWTYFFVFTSLTLTSEVAFSLTSPQDARSSHSSATLNTNFETLCNLKEAGEEPYLFAWREIPQHAQGCAVPYSGPQGHGQHPEEVHIVHITEIDRLIQTLSNQHGMMVSITLWLEAASCQNKLSRFPSAARSTESKVFSKNDSNVAKAEIKITVPKMILPMLKVNDMGTDNVSVHSSKTKDTKQTPSYPLTQENRPLVFLLTSDQPVIWHIKPGACWTQKLASKIQAVVERGSSVESDLSVEVIQKVWVKKINRKTIQRYARRTYHGVASFTQIRAANVVRVGVGPGNILDRKSTRPLSWHNRNKLNFCDFSSREESNLVSAALSVPSKAESCVLGNVNSTKSFIIEIQYPSDNESGMSDMNLHGSNHGANSSQAILPQMMVFLSENNFAVNHKNEGIEQKFGNFTVVLKSDRHVQWILSSLIENSTLNVVTNDGDVIDCINDCGKTLELISLPLPESRSELLSKILANFGSPLHYFNIKYTTGFALKIGSPANQNAQIMGQFHQYLSPSNIPMPSSFRPLVNLSGTSKRKYILRVLESDMIITCEKSLFEIVLSSPSLMHVGVKGIHLKDKSCYSLSNGTHFILKSQLESCGSTVHMDGKSSVISNRVYVDYAPQNEESLNIGDVVLPEDKNNENFDQAGVPVVCGLKPIIDEDIARSIFNIRESTSSAEDRGMENSSPDSSSSSSIYQLELYHKALLSSDISSVNFKSTVDMNDQIFGQVWMDDAPSARAIPESCWVSNLSHSDQKIFLLRGMCPAKSNVKLESSINFHLPSKPKSFVFSFQVSTDFSQLGQEFFVHCQVGVCLSNSKISKAKSLLCVDPHDYCKQQDPHLPRTNLVSTAHQLLTRGPIVLSSVGSSFIMDSTFKSKCSEATVLPHRTINMDMTVVIAFCSFAIGIGLTATLWLIHNKTEPKRHGCHIREHSLGSQSAVLGSSLSPHSACSSTNSQCAINA